jgi:hypothetical protein
MAERQFCKLVIAVRSRYKALKNSSFKWRSSCGVISAVKKHSGKTSTSMLSKVSKDLSIGAIMVLYGKIVCSSFSNGGVKMECTLLAVIGAVALLACPIEDKQTKPPQEVKPVVPQQAQQLPIVKPCVKCIKG